MNMKCQKCGCEGFDIWTERFYSGTIDSHDKQHMVYCHNLDEEFMMGIKCADCGQTISHIDMQFDVAYGV